jgi:uncharacterized protein YidB (DUF937 family)
MDIVQMGVELLSKQMGSQTDANSLSNALSGLLGDGQGTIDLAGLAGKMASSGELGNILNSWLGDGANSAITAESLTNLLGDSKISEFASKLGTDSQSAANGLAGVLPQLMDKSSSGGSLLDSVGGLDGLLGAASSFLK